MLPSRSAHVVSQFRAASAAVKAWYSIAIRCDLPCPRSPMSTQGSPLSRANGFDCCEGVRGRIGDLQEVRRRDLGRAGVAGVCQLNRRTLQAASSKLLTATSVATFVIPLGLAPPNPRPWLLVAYAHRRTRIGAGIDDQTGSAGARQSDVGRSHPADSTYMGVRPPRPRGSLRQDVTNIHGVRSFGLRDLVYRATLNTRKLAVHT